MSGLYIHIPFCIRKCAYCDFVSFADHAPMRDYLAALRREMQLRAREGCFASFDTVFIGGGTPSVLPAGEVATLLEAAQGCFSILPDAEITIETNPGTLTPDKLSEYAGAGVNRLSVGLQCSQNHLLKAIGRIHTWEDFLQSWAYIQDAGFRNSNIDVMYGLPAQTLAAHEATLRAVAALSPAHISAYSLILEEGTPLFDAHPDLPNEDETYAMHLLTRTLLTELGYARYEISNYAKPGSACRHNLNYWDNGAYLGVGLNAYSAWMRPGWTRFCNTADMRAYLAALSRGELPASYTPIPQREEMFECVMLGLRRTDGLDTRAFANRFGVAFASAYPAATEALIARGWAVWEAGRFRLNEEGLDMQNAALLSFMD
ncbi:MAG: radical SAM family heme chaperone HemW [Clostridia bacterium]|nr:radical SAM family heme chaperone HemW [Clostridia bacterium]